MRGFVKEWNVREGWGVVIDENEKDASHRSQCQYYVHWSDIAGLNVKHLEVNSIHSIYGFSLREIH